MAAAAAGTPAAGTAAAGTAAAIKVAPLGSRAGRGFRIRIRKTPFDVEVWTGTRIVENQALITNSVS